MITQVQMQETSYPTAKIEGLLSLKQGCLLVDDAVVFWPAETGWDRSAEAVTFAGDFEGAAPARVGSNFSGGGGGFALTDDLSGMLSADNARTLRECANSNGVDQLVLAYPETS